MAATVSETTAPDAQTRSDSRPIRPLSHRLVLPAIFLVIAGGLASPFIIAQLKHRTLSENETEALGLIDDYIKAQQLRHSTVGADGEYARSFDQLALPTSYPDIDDSKSAPLHGYRFRILTSSNDAPKEAQWLDKQGRLTGGFGLLAVPADYMITARDTFLVSGADVYCIDLGPRTPQMTREMRSFAVPANAKLLTEKQ